MCGHVLRHVYFVIVGLNSSLTSEAEVTMHPRVTSPLTSLVIIVGTLTVMSVITLGATWEVAKLSYSLTRLVTG